ncbi:hypothetical protein [Ensifer canadensis]|uniref:hypothetical protein n=1 Tax=Ensifer canadensis TaxID=555315 RepID=UPI00193F7677|nr:hypothetical protein [Ensifer canadensis]UBI79312.1 hypothetical protein J3R84_20435 [Ensifer canadensis]
MLIALSPSIELAVEAAALPAKLNDVESAMVASGKQRAAARHVKKFVSHTRALRSLSFALSRRCVRLTKGNCHQSGVTTIAAIVSIPLHPLK